MNKKALPVLWSILLATVGAMFALGFIKWPELRVSMPAPGLAAGMGMLGSLAGVGLFVWLVVVRIVYRKSYKANLLSLWIIAEALAVIGLGVYAIPEFPTWIFNGMMAFAAGLLLVTHPFRSVPEKEEG